MKLFADESIEREIIQKLRDTGHEILSVAEIQPGITDDEVLQRAADAGLPLLTNDKDFGALVYLHRSLSSGPADRDRAIGSRSANLFHSTF